MTSHWGREPLSKIQSKEETPNFMKNAIGDTKYRSSCGYYTIPPKINPETSRLGRWHSDPSTCSKCQDDSQPGIPVFRMWREGILKPPGWNPNSWAMASVERDWLKTKVKSCQEDSSHEPQVCELCCSLLAPNAAKVRICLNVQFKQFLSTIVSGLLQYFHKIIPLFQSR